MVKVDENDDDSRANVRNARDKTAELLRRCPRWTGTGATYFDSSRFDEAIEMGYLRLGNGS